jgi:hypothetical protein
MQKDEVCNSDEERTKRKGGEAIEILRWQFHLNGLPSYITDFGERLLNTFGPEYRITEAAYIQVNQGCQLQDKHIDFLFVHHTNERCDLGETNETFISLTHVLLRLRMTPTWCLRVNVLT